MDMKIVVGGTLIDGTGADPIENAVIVIENERIKEVGRKGEVSIPQGAQTIDAAGKTILPGLIEAHVHLWGAKTMNPHDWLIDPIGLCAIRSAVEAQRLLEAGYTSVRDLGSKIALDLKQAINEGSVPGPRIFAAGKCLSQTAGHGDAHDLPMTWLVEKGWFGRMADGPDEFRKAAREQLRAGADFLKVMNTGGVMSEKDHPHWPQMTVEETRAVVEEASNVNTIVATHAQGTQGIKNGIKAGVKTIEHGIFLDDECIEMMLKKDVILVPTLSVIRNLARIGHKHGVPEYGVRKAKETSEIHFKNVQKAVAAGVTVAAGADFLGPEMCKHGDNAMELGFLVEAGLTPMDAIVAGTRNSALALGPRGLDLGTLEEGKLTDLLIVDGDPLKDIQVLQEPERIKVIMKGGKVVSRKFNHT
ncbi:MAG: amidohydrolase family protein [Candidatus Hodarchaeota archaeon]